MNIKKFFTLFFKVFCAAYIISIISMTKLSYAHQSLTNLTLETVYPTFLDWKKACAQLPLYVKQPDSKKTALKKHEFELALQEFLHTMQQSSFNKKSNWLKKKTIPQSLFDIKPPKKSQEKKAKPFYTQKIIVNSDTQCIIYADCHADIHSVIAFLEDIEKKGYLHTENPFILQKKNVYLCFLGDYVDKGNYSAEVLYTIMRLKIANPDKVFLIRGNHDYRGENLKAGFDTELQNKFLYATFKDFHKIYQAYNLLCSALYVGVQDEKFTNYLLINHGGLEPRYNPHKLLADKKNLAYQWIRKLDDISWLSQELQELVTQEAGLKLKNKPTEEDIGFYWNNFIINDADQVNTDRGIELEFGKNFTTKFLEYLNKKDAYKVHGIIRGHQHEMINTLIKHGGIYNFWSEYQFMKNGTIIHPILQFTNGTGIWTLNVSPDNFYGKMSSFNFATYAIVDLPKNPTKWRITPHILQIFEKNK